MNKAKTSGGKITSQRAIYLKWRKSINRQKMCLKLYYSMCHLGIGQEMTAKVYDATKLSTLMLYAYDLKLDKIRHGDEQVHNFLQKLICAD